MRTLPASLTRELQMMKRDPSEFSVVRKVACQFGCGKAAALALTHLSVSSVGSWCPQHGWLYFDSRKLESCKA